MEKRWRFPLNILHLKTYYSKIIQSLLIVTLKHILGLILRNGHCAQVILQIKYTGNFLFLISLDRHVSIYRYVNRFELYLV